MERSPDKASPPENGLKLPFNARIGANTMITGQHAFKRFRSKRADALSIGHDCTMDGVHFALGPAGRVVIGDYCYFTNATLLCEDAVSFGSYVMIGWNATIADSDFHPLDPAQRIADAIACSPLAGGRPRPEIKHSPVVIADDVWIGPNATILKGVTVGAGALIQPGALVTRDIPAMSIVSGNPAEIVGTR
jgi:acetyltransferase-like isoleucine patch superfamily enzyme